MKLSNLIAGAWAAAGVLSVAGCGGGGSSSGMSTSGYAITNLVSNRSAVVAMHTDANLVNPWGIAFNPQGFVWVSNNGTSTSTLYDGNGVAQSLVVTVPAGGTGVSGPTGIVFNQSSDFVVSSGGVSGAAAFLFASVGGVISGWAPGVNATHAIVAVDNSASAAAYTGLAIGKDSNNANFIYAADFHNARIDVYDGTFTKVTPSGGFVDVSVPSGYAPFGIQNIPSSSGATQIYVSYAQPDPVTHRSAAGAGLGYVAVFDADGTLIKHLVSQGALNAPWGMVMAPANFGPMSGALLVGNFGDGAINAYNASTGASMGPLMQPSGAAVSIGGLWGMAFGNGLNSQPVNTLFFAAGVNGEADGVYGRIDFGTSAGTGGSLGY